MKQANNSSIRVQAPSPRESIQSPLTVTGEARGSWFFEGRLSIKLKADDRVIARGVVTSQSDWMTTSFVPFGGTLRFQVPPETDRGQLVIESANPSGRKETQKRLVRPVVLADPDSQ